MNVLPTAPDGTGSIELLDQYFKDMKRWNFDVPYSAFYAFPLKEVKGRFKKPYMDFVRMAHDGGYPACVQIQSTVGFLDDVSLDNAQYYSDNSTYVYQHFKKYGRKNFFGSFAAPGWLDYIKKITRILRSYGFDWVVFEEPMFRVDIPGSKDKLYERFRQTFPDLEYPTRQDESLAYICLQELKSNTLVDFYRKLCLFAKDIGFRKCGIMPWFFIPTFENTPMETWNTCCPINKLTFLDDLDFIVVRMQPDNVYAQATIASCGEAIPQISYLENLAQNLGKPILAVNNPTNEHIRLSADTPDNLLPYDYFARYSLAAAAAVPHGMTRHWYRKDYNRDNKHMDLMTQTNRFLTRMGSPHSSFALVFSYSAMNRTVPRPWTETWKAFWFLAHKLLYEEKYPALVFYADTLEQSLHLHPETKILIFNEYFSIPPKEVELVGKWLAADPSRSILYIGARNGYRSQPDSLYHHFEPKSPEILRLFGCNPDKSIRTVSDGEIVTLHAAGKRRQTAFLGSCIDIRCHAYGIPPILDQSRAQVLYAAGKEKKPVIFSYNLPEGGKSLFIGLSTDGLNNDLPLRQILDFLLEHASPAKSAFPILKNPSSGVLWNRTANGFILVSNCDNTKGSYDISPDRSCKIWDVRKDAFLNERRKIAIPPLDFHVLKILEKGCRLLDIEGQIYLSGIVENPGNIAIKGFMNKSLILKLLEKPASVRIDQNDVDFTCRKYKSYYSVTVKPVSMGDMEISLAFK
ncbi:hypothetical protein JW926_17965 [Candidatus Sumerlaeota bacterium]|nr:hypothetical protein [Candidatus Sumerlaeota bacterium]